MVNAECSNPAGGVCLCLQDFFRRDKECPALKGPSEPCAETRECVAHADCARDFGALVCVCRQGFFFQRGDPGAGGGRCERRIKPGRPCSGLAQCIDNAECSGEEGGLCQCDKG